MTIHGKLSHSSHRHDLELKRRSRPYTCNRCGEFGLHTRYECPSSSCNFHLHKACAHARDDPRIRHDFFPRCEFVFMRYPAEEGLGRRSCDACARPVKRYNYHCSKKDLDLHPNCSKLPTMMVNGDVVLRLRDRVSSECNYCGKKKYGDEKRSWCYVSGGGEVCLHVACVTDMLVEAWEEECLRSSSGHRGGSRGRSNNRGGSRGRSSNRGGSRGRSNNRGGSRGRSSNRGGSRGRSNNKRHQSRARSLMTRETPRLHIVPREGRNQKIWKFAAKCAKYAKIIVCVVTAIFGDPSSLVVNLFASLM